MPQYMKLHGLSPETVAVLIEDIMGYNVQVRHIPKGNNQLIDYMSWRSHSSKEAPEYPRHIPQNKVAVLHNSAMP